MKLNYVQTLAVLIELFCAKMCFEFFQPLRFLIKSDCTFIKSYLNSQSYLSGRAVLLVLLLYSIPLHKLNNKSKGVWDFTNDSGIDKNTCTCMYKGKMLLSIIRTKMFCYPV